MRTVLVLYTQPQHPIGTVVCDTPPLVGDEVIYNDGEQSFTYEVIKRKWGLPGSMREHGPYLVLTVKAVK